MEEIGTKRGHTRVQKSDCRVQKHSSPDVLGAADLSQMKPGWGEEREK